MGFRPQLTLTHPARHLPGSRAFDEAHVKFWQHALMYAFFVLAGCVDLLAARSLPPAAPLAALSLAFAGEALLFWFHLGTQEGLLRLAHLLLVVAIAGCAAAAAAEAAGGGGPVAALARCLFTLLQGSWFLQIGRVWYSSDRGWVNDGAAEMVRLLRAGQQERQGRLSQARRSEPESDS